MNLLAWWTQVVDVGQSALLSLTGLLKALAATLVALGLVVTAVQGLRHKFFKRSPSKGTSQRDQRRKRDTATGAQRSQGSSQTSTLATRGDSAHLAPRVPIHTSSASVVFETEDEVVYPLWAPAQRALTAATRILASAYRVSQASYGQPRSQKPYAKQLAVLSAYAEACKSFASEFSALNGSLANLGIEWEGRDPVAVLLSHIDPFSSKSESRSPEAIERVCRAEAERIAQTLAQLEYPVVREQDRFDPHGPPTYKLVKPDVRRAQLE